MEKFDLRYWEHQWKNGETQWDIGYPAPAITAYIDGLKNKEIKILIPGCGNAYEGEYLLRNGFSNTYLLDMAPRALTQVRKRFPTIERDNFLLSDFFDLGGHYDLIIEQTFFCALDPNLRKAYAKKMHSLLSDGGLLVGLFFDATLNDDHPPFGGSKAEYVDLFEEYFEIRHLERCYNSIKPREGRELFGELVRK